MIGGEAVDHKDDVASALEDLRRQLYRAQDEGRGEQFRFEVEKAELHLEVQVRKDATGKAKLSIGAAGAEAGGATGQSRTHKLVLVLNVRDDATNDPVEIQREEHRIGSAWGSGGAGATTRRGRRHGTPNGTIPPHAAPRATRGRAPPGEGDAPRWA
ncbi:trypco2 family protein [Streptomyces sp. DSM 15324]|uniref:trypco2 family protein n=1 Tax=Streptomyces sp. DSM 15324 TaxID=1739111 RepID=UPI00131B88DD|nr:trypco2 family protein [Streptomyces sp. DSM 15324]